MAEKFRLNEVARWFENSESGILERDIVRAGSQSRKLREPKTISETGEIKGRWRDCVFIPDDAYIPTRHNPRKETMGEIRERLQQTYGIHFEGIPYVFGSADFSEVSLAHISTADMVSCIIGISAQEYEAMPAIQKAGILKRAFGDREQRKRNAGIAAEIAAKQQIPIRGLPKGYSAEDLKRWINGRCSWDEQVSTGYNLVPLEIHENVPHTGMVSIAHNSFPYLKSRARKIKKYPEMYAWNEDKAPISYGEVKNNPIYRKFQRKGDREMPRNRMKLGKLTIDQKGELNDIKDSANEHIKTHEDLEKLGEKYQTDMDKLNLQREKIMEAGVSESEKQKLLAELEAMEDRVNDQYNQAVQREMEKERDAIKEATDAMQERADEFAQQAEELRNIEMDAARVNTAGAAEIAESKKEEYEKAKEEYTEKLNLRIAQARRQQENLRKKRLGGQ